MVTLLLSTKLFLPPTRSDRVERPRLLDRLDALTRSGACLGLISAPAGFGKTSLAAEWVARRGKPAAWLSLDAGDNDPAVFLAYLLAALERARPGCVPDSAALLRAPEAPPGQVVLATLLNELAQLNPADPLVIVLDDLQFVESAQVQEGMAFLVEHLPPGARLLIATRADPALPLARLRARRLLVELRAADLRFTPEEAADFLVHSLGGDAAEIGEIAGVLSSRTEGWAAGLQMAALALQSDPAGTGSRAAFVRAFSGSHHFVLDYLAEEVLARRTREEENFLLQTSLLERFNAALCSAVTGLNEAECRRMLETFEADNLFLVPLDGERTWFRYHYLFSDLLRARLKQSQPQQIAPIHRRASEWFQSTGWFGEAIHHALAAAGAAEAPEQAIDYERAAAIVEGHTFQVLQRGEMRAMLGWIRMLPAELSARRPWLCIYRAWTLALGGELGQVEPLLVQGEAQREGMEERSRRTLDGNIAALRAYAAMNANQPETALEQAQKARALLPETDWATGFINWNIGYTLRMVGRLEEAAQEFEEQLSRARAADDVWGVTNNATDMGLVRRMQGRLSEALEIYRRGLEIVEAHGARKLGYVGRLLTAYAAALYEQNHLDKAETLLAEAVDLNRRWQNANHEVFAAFHLAKVLTARKDFAGAAALLESALQVVREQGVVPVLKRLTDGALLELRLARGQVPPAGGPLEGSIQAALADNAAVLQDEGALIRNTLLARVLLAQARPTEALGLLEPIESCARAGARGSALIETLVLKSLSLHLLGQVEPALEALNEAAALAAPENAVRTIIDTAPLVPGALGQMLMALIREPGGRRAYGPERTFLAQLRSVLEDSGKPEAPAVPASPVALIDPLSERELEVLRLMAEGLTNPQIAARLVISPGTVKAHTAAIFRKLDANTRTQAVAIARSAKIIT